MKKTALIFLLLAGMLLSVSCTKITDKPDNESETAAKATDTAITTDTAKDTDAPEVENKEFWSFDKDTGTLTIDFDGAKIALPSFRTETVPWNGIRPYIKAIVIKDGVTGIGEQSFENCPQLTSVTLPDSVKKIDKKAFFNCPKLTEINLPKKLTYIGDTAFAMCGFTELNLPENVSEISGHAFAYCETLVKVELNKNLMSIGSRAFDSCDALKEVIIPDIDDIADYAFANCQALETVTIGEKKSDINFTEEKAFPTAPAITYEPEEASAS